MGCGPNGATQQTVDYGGGKHGALLAFMAETEASSESVEVEPVNPEHEFRNPTP